MMKCTRSVSRACATVRWRTNGSVSASPIPISISPPWRRAQGAQGFGPVTTEAELAAALAAAIAAVEAGGVAVVDVRVEPGYAPAMTGGA